MKKLSIGFHPNEKRKNPKNQKTQIVMRVIVDGLKREVRLPEVYDLSDKDLQTWNPIIQRIEAKDSDVNDYLNGIIARRKLLDLDILTSNATHTPTEIVEKLLGQKEVKQEVTVYDYTKRYLREEIENSIKEIGTKKNYRNAINQFCIFLELKGWKTLPLNQFKFEHANAFKKFLETPDDKLVSIGIDKNECYRLYTSNQVGEKVIKKKFKVQNSLVSSSTKIKNIKPIFEKAIEEDLVFKNPLKKIKLCFEGDDEAASLTPSMIKRVYDLTHIAGGVEYTKDLFLFMCFTGMAYIDTINFNDREFEIVDESIHLLDTKRRKKTGCKIKQILCSEATAIVNKYYQKGHTYNKSKVFPSETLVSLNRKLKIIQNIAELPFDLSTKNGRVTFKNSIRESNIQNVRLSQKLMAWGKSKSIEDIYDRFTAKDYMDAKNTFDEYLKQILKK
jgi:hypothetical protein